MSSPPLKVKCPTCKREVLWGSTNSYRPFCCERCKLIDLGEWAAEEKVIPGDTVPSDLDSYDESFYH